MGKEIVKYVSPEDSAEMNSAGFRQRFILGSNVKPNKRKPTKGAFGNKRKINKKQKSA